MMTDLSDTANQQSERRVSTGDRLPLPPGPGLLRLAWYARLLRHPDGMERLIAQLLDTYGPITRLEVAAPKVVIRLIEMLLDVKLLPYIVTSTPEANRLLMTGPSDQVQRAPTVPARFPGPEGMLQRQPTIATIDGEIQQQHRKLVMHAFQSAALRGYIPMMIDLVQRRAARWQGKINLFDEMSQLAMETLALTMLGLQPGSDAYVEFFALYWPIVLKQTANPERWQAKQRLWILLGRLVTERRVLPGDDALSVLIVSSDQQTEGRLTDETLVNYAYMLMDLGLSDIAIYLTYVIAAVVTRPAVLQRVLDEQIDATSDAMLALEQRLPFTMNILREVERVHPPVTMLFRYAAADMVLHGYRIPEGSWLMTALSQVHLSPTIFANPLVFDPDRFAPPRQEHKTPFALMGFGAGYHTCVANTYTRIQAAVVLHSLLKSYHLHVTSHQTLPAIDYRGTLQQPQEAIIVQVVLR